MIDFNRPAYVGRELEYIKDAVHRSSGVQYMDAGAF